MSIIDKPEDQSIGEYKKFFAELKAMYGAPEFVIGVTFGMDLEKWRIILRELFGKTYQEKKQFDKAYLFTDKVAIVDSNKKRDLLKGYLRYSVPKVKGYLHTKFILLKYVDKYILAVSSKNIANSTSYDMILPFISKRTEAEVGSHGKKIYDFLEYLKMPKDIQAVFENLKGVNFSTVEGKGKVTDFEIAYDEHRFSKKLWNNICSCNFIISPFIENEMVEKVDESAQKKKQEVKLLAYPRQIGKVLEESKVTAIQFYMGKVVEGKYNRREFIFQRRFHVKLYIKVDETECEKTRVYFGSANLTKDARDRHCEMLLGIEFDGKSEEYGVISELFENNSNMTELYDKENALMMGEDENEFQEDDGFNGSIAYEDKIYVSETSEGFQLNVVKKQKDKWVFKTIWGKPYAQPVYFVVDDDKMFCIERELYLEDEYIHMMDSNALTYDAYMQKTMRYLKQLKKENDWNVLMGEKISSKSIDAGSGDGKSGRINKIPCFYSAVFQQMAIQNHKLKTAISKDQMIDALEKMRELLFEEENIQLVEDMINQLKGRDE